MVAKDTFGEVREQMVVRQLIARGIHDERLLKVMRAMPRHLFVAAEVRHLAYRDCPLPIGDDQTISQPYIVALMTQMLQLRGHERVLEVGTGSGYQTAVLCRLAAQVYSLERHPRLAGRAAQILAQIGCDNVEIHVGDGSQGLPDMAPFDAIIVTAAAPALPGPLRSQLNEKRGRMVLPIGDSKQQYLERITRSGNRWEIEQTVPVHFVPLIGLYGFKDTPDDDLAGV